MRDIIQKRPAVDDMNLAHEALGRLTGSDAVSIEPVARQGLVNWVFRGEALGSRFAIRVNRQRDARKAHNKYAKERWSMMSARSVGIPAPEVLAIEKTRDRAWMIVEWIDGDHPASVPETYRQLGRYAQRLSTLRTPPPGQLFAGFSGGWMGQVDYNLEQLTVEDPLMRLGVYRAKEQGALRGAFELLRNARFLVGFQHGDLSPVNMISRPNGEAVLIDWGCARFDVVPIQPINDLRRSRLESDQPSHECLRALVEGTGVTWDEWTELEPTSNAWLVLKAIDLVRWALDRCPPRVDEVAGKAHRIVKAYLSHGLHLNPP